MGTKLSSGQLEITDSDLILYQKGKQPVKWPLKYLKRYGFEVKLFILIFNLINILIQNNKMQFVKINPKLNPIRNCVELYRKRGIGNRHLDFIKFVSDLKWTDVLYYLPYLYYVRNWFSLCLPSMNTYKSSGLK